MTRPRPLLSQQDWIDAGQALLIEGGATSVKLTPLLRRLKVTSGSFYHHFEDFPTYLDALADEYGTVNVDRITSLVRGVSPAERLLTLRHLLDQWDVPYLDRAMRIWATSNPRAAASVRRLDGELLGIVQEALIELGFDEADARVRALLMFSAGAGFALIFPPWELHPDDLNRALEFLMGRPGPAPGAQSLGGDEATPAA